jgi:hypothetical protein
MMRLLLIPAFLMLCDASAQNTDLLTRMRRTYQDHSAVYLKRNTTFRFEKSGEGYIAFRDVEEQQLMLKDQVGGVSAEEVHYSGLTPLKDLNAYAMVPQGKKLKKVPISHVEHKDVRGGSIFHDDNRSASFHLPSMNSGAISHISYTLQFPDAHLATGHHFASVIPTEESTLTVITAPDVEVDIRLFHLPDSAVERSVTMEKGKRVQRITLRQVPAIEFAGNAPKPIHYLPHAHLIFKESTDEADDVGRLYRWSYDQIKEAYGSIDPQLQHLADSLVQGISGEIQKAQRIYRWVQDNITYIAFEDGMNGLIPAPAQDVCRVRYGDCKGMSNLLRSLLRAAGLEAHLAWVGTRSLPYSYEQLPSVASSDHMIVALDLADTTYFLDPTASYNAFGRPSGFIQGKEALIAIDSVTHLVRTVPTVHSSFNAIVDSVSITLQGTDVFGVGTASFSGYERYNLEHVVRTVPQQKWKEVMRNMLMKGSNKFQLDEVTASGLEDRTAPLVLSYQFRIPDHVRVSGDRSYMPLLLEDPWKGMRSREDRSLPVEMDHSQLRVNIVSLELPEGLTSSGLPAPAASSTSDLSYDITYQQQGQQVISRGVFRVEPLLLDEELSEWNRMNNELLKELNRNIILTPQ